VAVRGGSHSVPGFGTADDAVVIDLVRMQAVEVDPTKKTARAQGGATWGAFNDATHEHGLATTGGIISTTGVGGLTLGGRIGYLSRGHGLSCDNLRAAEVVTADGRIVSATENENEDLFWALRGGGGNFGVVTTFEFDLHPVREVYGGPILFELPWYRAPAARSGAGLERSPECSPSAVVLSDSASGPLPLGHHDHYPDSADAINAIPVSRTTMPPT
jgi:FAD/FMN-containing dehydrogenase